MSSLWDNITNGLGKKAVQIGAQVLKLPNIVGSIAGELLFPEPAGVPDSEINWDYANRQKLIEDTLDALKQLPSNKDPYKKDAPIQTPPKNAPSSKKPKSQPPFKLPNAPNLPSPTNPFVPSGGASKRPRPISGRSITKNKLGNMEAFPISYAPDVQFNIIHEVIGKTIAEENAKQGVGNFIKWVTRENGNLSPEMVEDSMLEGGENSLYGDTLWDQIAFLTPKEQANWTGPLSIQFGAATIADEAADCNASRQNAGLVGAYPVIYWNKPIIKVRESGNKDVSERLSNEDLSSSFDGIASTIKDALEYYGERTIKQLDIVNHSNGATSKKLGIGGIGEPEYAPMSFLLNERDPKEEIELLTVVIENYESNLNQVSEGERKYLEREIERLKKEIADVTAGKKFRSVKTLSEKVDLYADLTSQILGHWPILIEFEDGTLITQSIEDKEPGKGSPGADSFEDSLKEADPQNRFKVKKNGDVKLNFPNLSEAIADLTGLIMDGRAEQALLKEMIMRLATESCSNKNIVMEIYDYVDALIDFMGFDIAYEKDYHIIPFNPTIIDKSSFSDYEFCIGKAIERRKPLFNLNKDNQTLIAKMHIYDQSASIIRATLAQEFTGLNLKNANATSQNAEGIKDPKQYFARLAAMVDEFGGYKDSNPAKKGDESYSFKKRLEAIEQILRTKNQDGTLETDSPKIRITSEEVLLYDNSVVSVGNAGPDKKQQWIPGIGRVSK